jgi:hypothetical protein
MVVSRGVCDGLIPLSPVAGWFERLAAEFDLGEMNGGTSRVSRRDSRLAVDGHPDPVE